MTTYTRLGPTGAPIAALASGSAPPTTDHARVRRMILANKIPVRRRLANRERPARILIPR